MQLRGLARRPAVEARSLLRVSRALVVSVLRVGAQRPAAFRECLTGCHHRLRCSSLLDPTHERLEQVEMIECGRPTGTVTHARHEKQAAPPRDRLETAVVPGELVVIADGLLRGEPRIADAVEENELAAVPGECV